MSDKDTIKENTVPDVEAHILGAASTLFEPGQVVELRVIFTNGRIDSGYFNDYRLLAGSASHYDQDNGVKGIFWTLNPVRAECLERAPNRMRISTSSRKGEHTTSDADISERRLVLIDIDPDRPSGISSTQEELDAAKRKAQEVSNFLESTGWTPPVIGMSGNGYHLLYRVSLPNDAGTAARMKNFLTGLSNKFSDNGAKIDTVVHNAARISKAFGTISRKGDPTAERPHRRSMLLKNQTGYKELSRGICESG